MDFFSIQGLTKQFGGLVACNNIDLVIKEREVIGLIGPNGAGKSTFFALIAGFYKPDAGKVSFLGEDITGKSPEEICQRGIARTFQIVRPFSGMTVLENILVGVFSREKNMKRARNRAEEVLTFTGLASRRNVLAGELTIADKKRLELARALATRPKMILLDEVMAGLNPKETQEAVELIRAINEQGITLFVVEHVMEVIMPISERVVVLDGGNKIAEGPPEEVAKNPEVIKAYLGEKYHAAG
ncbi:MAG: ABC transporter ATP-binding protein [Firmicutes bacterium]|nr:ABC transporter ATP-binding protein [Bacillota bacterium]